MRIAANIAFNIIKIAMMGVSILPMMGIIWGVGTWLTTFGLSFQGFLVAMMLPSVIALAIGGSCYYLLMKMVARAIHSE